MANSLANEVLTDSEAQKFLRLSRITLWQLRKSRQIAFHKVGEKILYRRGDLDAFLNSIRQETKQYEKTAI